MKELGSEWPVLHTQAESRSQRPCEPCQRGQALLKVVGGKVKKPGKRGRKPAKIDLKAKLERSRQSARECRARKKLRYQYLEELVSSRERAICALREELEMYKQWCMAMDQGKIPSEIKALLTGEEQSKSQQNLNRHTKAGRTDANSNSW
ncbi:cAMP-responsive element-binding protein-like 2 isoform X2 [Artibeus jamaicensis]|nr:cAMP-responsive element-binding protein-like 2 isoform X2 [Artibeus jamaicensis]XP_053517623.1 cAMP-responsive element-binding protein-like 2 isoform X2 [Artibeus jamaicensis]